ncbi:MAG: GNAT family N-acetyltransferase, partial [Mycobacterium leprae]
MPFEDWYNFVSGADWFRPEACLYAMDGDRMVGMAAMSLRKDGDTPYLYHNMTGVLQEYRGRGIALALKVLGLQVARKLGAVYLKTDNDERNAPMLAINRKMGFRPLPGTYFLNAKLD